MEDIGQNVRCTYIANLTIYSRYVHNYAPNSDFCANRAGPPPQPQTASPTSLGVPEPSGGPLGPIQRQGVLAGEFGKNHIFVTFYFKIGPKYGQKSSSPPQRPPRKKKSPPLIFFFYHNIKKK